jgi:hypothetical protein
VAFQNTSDDGGNASITPEYPQNPVSHHLHPAASAHAKPEVTFGLVPLCRKNHLATYT